MTGPDLDAAARVLAEGCAAQDARTPREAAEAAWIPGGPPVDELEQTIRADRRTPALRDTA